MSELVSFDICNVKYNNTSSVLGLQFGFRRSFSCCHWAAENVRGVDERRRLWESPNEFLLQSEYWSFCAAGERNLAFCPCEDKLGCPKATQNKLQKCWHYLRLWEICSAFTVKGYSSSVSLIHLSIFVLLQSTGPYVLMDITGYSATTMFVHLFINSSKLHPNIQQSDITASTIELGLKRSLGNGTNLKGLCLRGIWILYTSITFYHLISLHCGRLVNNGTKQNYWSSKG